MDEKRVRSGEAFSAVASVLLESKWSGIDNLSLKMIQKCLFRDVRRPQRSARDWMVDSAGRKMMDDKTHSSRQVGEMPKGRKGPERGEIGVEGRLRASPNGFISLN